MASDEVLAGDGNLLGIGVAVEAHDLHPVEERAGDLLGEVGRGQEEHVRQIEIQIKVMVPESVVLGRVEHLEQRRRRIPPPVAAELVDLVEEHHRVHRAGVLYGPGDTAR